MRKTIYRLLGRLLVLGILHACSGQEKNSLELNSEEDLTGLAVACSSGSYYHDQLLKRDDISLFVANTEGDCVQALCKGMVDVYVSDEVIFTQEMMNQLGVRKALSGKESFEVSFALRKGSDKLLGQLDDFISNGPVRDIMAHWLEGGPAITAEPVSLSPDAVPLRCITATNMEPVSFVGNNGQWTGFDVEILRSFAASIGRPAEFSLQDLGSAIMALQTGQADIITGCLFITEERKKSVDFTIPYYHCHPGYFVRDSQNKGRPGMGERLKNNLITEGRWKLIADGLLETLKITFLSILLGTLLGAGICLCRRSRRKWARTLAGLYGDFINGIPTLVLLLIMFYVVFGTSGLNASLVAVITFALCFASSAGAIFDTSIGSVPKGQTEAGLSLGFTPARTFTGIVFPQAAQIGLPLYAGECVSLLKSTSIVGYIAIQDLTRASDLIRSRTFDALIPLMIVTILYFFLAWIIRRLLNLFLLKK